MLWGHMTGPRLWGCSFCALCLIDGSRFQILVPQPLTKSLKPILDSFMGFRLLSTSEVQASNNAQTLLLHYIP